MTFQWRAGEKKCLDIQKKSQCLQEEAKKTKYKSIAISFVLSNRGKGEGLNLQIKKTKGFGQKSEKFNITTNKKIEKKLKRSFSSDLH